MQSIPEVDPSACKCCSADVVGIFLLFVVQGFEMRLDGERNNGGRVIGKILLESRLVHGVLDHCGGVNVRKYDGNADC